MLLRIRPFPTRLHVSQQKSRGKYSRIDEVCSWVSSSSSFDCLILLELSPWSAHLVFHSGFDCRRFFTKTTFMIRFDEKCWEWRQSFKLQFTQVKYLTFDSRLSTSFMTLIGMLFEYEVDQVPGRLRSVCFHFKSLWETGLLAFRWLTMPFCGEHTRRNIILSIFMLAFSLMPAFVLLLKSILLIGWGFSSSRATLRCVNRERELSMWIVSRRQTS